MGMSNVVELASRNRAETLVSWEGSDDELLDARQAAALLTVQPKTLTDWARAGKVPCIRLTPRVIRWTRPLLRQIRDAATERPSS